MIRLRNIAILVSLLALCASCVTSSPDDAENAQPAEDLSALDNSKSADNSLEQDLDQSKAPDQTPPADEFAQFEDAKPAEPPPAKPDEFAQFDEPEKAPEPPPAPAPEPPPPPPEVAQAPTPEPPPPPPPPEPPAEAQVANNLVNIKALQFKGNDNGGTVVVEADGPMTYSTRMNSANGQFTIDIPNSILPKKFTRPLVTKDFEGMIGSVDAYQSPGSNISRLIIHLREGSPEPVVQTEGSSLLVVANEPPPAPKEPEVNEVKLLSFNSLDEFLSGNMTFSGKKISIETDQIEIRDLFKLIGEEGGINLVISDEIKGTMSVKLRQVPWDQALVMVMKAKKLSYSRTGNVLRIATVVDLKAEEDQAILIETNKKTVAPIIVKIIPISYAKIADLLTQVKPFLSPRGNVIGDARTSALVVSDIDENLQRVGKLVQSIDIPPQQVLIEGKVVEAQENFQRQIGVQWQTSGTPVAAGSSSVGPVSATTNLNVIPGQVSPQTATISLNLGTLDILGSLNAILALQESEGNVKVLSSPRIVTLHNEEAVISQTQELPLITTTTSPNGAVSPTVSFKPVTLNLKVTPNITNDGSVLMKVDVTREFAGEIVNPATQARPINGRSASTRVLVRNGQTAVIGGIFQDDDSESFAKVPWIADVPIIGWLFKTYTKVENKNELLIFITPRILGQLDSQTLTPPSGEGGKL